ncbi:hypothetical protein [Photorhabdus khanii]|uniref:hypothetical protein n=1 Tax=Photorhabdus khanii TaxID=1004150 RepID=UPI00104F729F|nr:hypothetical protein [Photorhabdus khanii]
MYVKNCLYSARTPYPSPYNSSSLRFKLIVAFFAVLYGYILSYVLPLEAFLDRENYLIYASESQVILDRYISQGILSFFTNEPIWLLTNISLSLTFTPETTLRIIILVPASVIFYVAIINNQKYILITLIFLFMPQILKNNIIHLRQGFAIALFILSWYSQSKIIKNILLISTPFIHSSFFIIITLVFIDSFSNKLRLSAGLRAIIVTLFGLLIGNSLGFISSELGARQANEYHFSSASISGLGFIFWFCIFWIYFLQGKDFTDKNSFSLTTLVFYLSTYFFVEFSGRFLENSLLIVLMSGLQLKNNSFYYIMIFSYFIVAYLRQIYFLFGIS